MKRKKILGLLMILWIIMSSVTFAWYTSLFWYSVKMPWYIFYLKNIYHAVWIQLAIAGMIYMGFLKKVLPVVIAYVVLYISLVALFIYHFYEVNSVDPIYRMCYTLFLFIVACLGIDITLRSLIARGGGTTDFRYYRIIISATFSKYSF